MNKMRPIFSITEPIDYTILSTVTALLGSSTYTGGLDIPSGWWAPGKSIRGELLCGTSTNSYNPKTFGCVFSLGSDWIVESALTITPPEDGGDVSYLIEFRVECVAVDTAYSQLYCNTYMIARSLQTDEVVGSSYDDGSMRTFPLDSSLALDFQGWWNTGESDELALDRFRCSIAKIWTDEDPKAVEWPANTYLVTQEDWNYGSVSLGDPWSWIVVPASIDTTQNMNDFLLSVPPVSYYDSGSWGNGTGFVKIINQASLNGNMIRVFPSTDEWLNQVENGFVFLGDHGIKTGYPRVSEFSGWIFP